jgi:hypothetical protein
MPLAGFELAIPATKRPQTYTLESAASGITYPNLKKLNYQVNSFAIQIFHANVGFVFFFPFYMHSYVIHGSHFKYMCNDTNVYRPKRQFECNSIVS